MNPQDLASVERRLGVHLPEDYRQAMLTYPFAPDSQAEELWLLNDPEQLVQINAEYRADGFFGLPWLPTYLAVGGDGAGNAYLLDLTRDPTVVLFADHEARTITYLASGVGAWIDELRRREAEVEEDERLMAERHRTRRWWQVWR